MVASDTISTCLGHPAHAARVEDLFCRVCGALVAGCVLPGQFRAQRLLGRGRSGAAYLATHIPSNRLVVVKLFPANGGSVQLWERARRDASRSVTLRQPSILPVYNVVRWLPDAQPSSPGISGVPPGAARTPYLMTLCQYAPNSFARLFLTTKRVASEEQAIAATARLVTLLRQAGTALNAAHAQGLVHGALVPGNILFDAQDHLWVADFGLARLHPPLSPYLAPELPTNSTVAYWSALTPASDQYMLAILCYNLFLLLLRPGDYQSWLPVLRHALAVAPEQRYPGVDAFLYELLALMIRKPPAESQTVTEDLMTDYIDWHQMPTQPQTATMPETPGTPIIVTGPVAAANRARTAEEWEQVGNAFLAARNYRAAIQAYLQAITSLDSRKATVWAALGQAYSAQNDYADALTAYEQALSLKFDEPTLWLNKAAVYEALGQYNEAEGCYEQARILKVELRNVNSPLLE